MATSYTCITEEQAALIETAPLFFVASAAPDMAAGPAGQGAVNLSPKGGTPLHIIDANRVAYLDYEGSGNQTARHARAGGPITVMVMSMDSKDAVVRLFGHARVVPIEESELAPLLLESPAQDLELPQRQIIDSLSRARRRAVATACPCSPTRRSGYASSADVPIRRQFAHRSHAGRLRIRGAPTSQCPSVFIPCCQR